MSSRAGSTRVGALALLAAAAVAALWLFVRDDDTELDGHSEAGRALGGLESSGESAVDERAPAELAQPRGNDAATPPLRADASTRSGALPSGEASTPNRTAVSTGGVQLEVMFQSPNFEPLHLARVTAELEFEAGARTSAEAVDAASLRLPLDTDGVATLRIVAEGHHHRAQELVVERARIEPDDRGQRVLRVDAVLWPADWVSIVVETPDGRPFTDLAAAFGLQPQALFAGAFVARVSALPPGGGDPPPHDSTLAKFHGTRGHKSFVREERGVGALELLRPPPLWVGLELYGASLGWQSIAPGDWEVRFTLGVDTLDALLAGLEFIVVEQLTGAPLAGARAELRADSPAHRRADLEATTGPDGAVRFIRVLPGRYELNVEYEHFQHQEFLEFAIAERRRLGPIRLESRGGLEVLVVDAKGRPARASVEIGSYRPGQRPAEFFPQSLRHHSDAAGLCTVPTRATPMVLRASVEIGRTNKPKEVQEVGGTRSAFLIVYPTQLPPQPVRLTLAESKSVQVTSSIAATARIDILDPNGIVVARATGTRAMQFDSIAGSYEVRVYDEKGEILRTATADWTKGPRDLRLD